MKKIIKSIVVIFFPLLVGGVVGFITSKGMDYKTLVKPPLSPPGFLFPIIWTIIFLLMGIGYFLIIRKDSNYEDKVLYYLQLFVNSLWSIIFFSLKWRGFSVIWILLLDFLVILLVRSFFRNNKVAGYLQLPYLLWALFATYLNIGIYILN